jgi:hypothetical protein
MVSQSIRASSNQRGIEMHHHNWDSYLHFPLAAVWMTMPWWFNFDTVAHVTTFVMGLVIGGLQIAYLVRKHRRLGK